MLMKTISAWLVILFVSFLFAGCATLGFVDNSGTQLRQELQSLNGQNYKAADAMLGRGPDDCPLSILDEQKAIFPGVKQTCWWSIYKGQGPDRFVQTGTTTTSAVVGMEQGNGWAAPVFQAETSPTGYYEDTHYSCEIIIYYDGAYPDPNRKIIGSTFSGSCGP